MVDCLDFAGSLHNPTASLSQSKRLAKPWHLNKAVDRCSKATKAAKRDAELSKDGPDGPVKAQAQC